MAANQGLIFFSGKKIFQSWELRFKLKVCTCMTLNYFKLGIKIIIKLFQTKNWNDYKIISNKELKRLWNYFKQRIETIIKIFQTKNWNDYKNICMYETNPLH